MGLRRGEGLGWKSKNCWPATKALEVLNFVVARGCDSKVKAYG